MVIEAAKAPIGQNTFNIGCFWRPITALSGLQDLNDPDSG
ncbi:hypothetical protein GGD62_000866 [Bradyrhizobium sp. ERR14]|nr:hypothetical protein [Bradyrhizobium sp. ERR14]